MIIKGENMAKKEYKTDVLIVGASAAGIVAAVSAKSKYKDKKITVVRNFEKSLVPCGIPYQFGILKGSDKNVIPDSIFKKFKISLLIDNINEIDRKNKLCKGTNYDISYDKLILATGSSPKVPGWLKGSDKENVFVISKDKSDLDGVYAELKKCKKVVVVGGGFIGIEMADELKKMNLDITVVEVLPHILGLVFDEEISTNAESELRKKGIRILTSKGIKEVLGDKKATGVLLDGGFKVKADAVILAMGYAPNSELAKDAGLKVDEKGFIIVDKYQRTSDKDIFAAGDCAEKTDFLTGKPSGVMLSSIATREARIAGLNLYDASVENDGALPIFSTWIVESGYGAAGVSEQLAKKEGFDVVTGSGETVDKHPGTLPNAHKQFVKLIVNKKNHEVIGGECIAGESTGELTNVMGMIVQRRMKVEEVLLMQIGTQPKLTAAPTSYPIISAAADALSKL